jgi:hypothetical protein
MLRGLLPSAPVELLLCGMTICTATGLIATYMRLCGFYGLSEIAAGHDYDNFISNLCIITFKRSANTYA